MEQPARVARLSNCNWLTVRGLANSSKRFVIASGRNDMLASMTEGLNNNSADLNYNSADTAELRKD